VSIGVNCPHCRAYCQVAREHLAGPVRCARCGSAFTVRPAPAVPPPPAPTGPLRLEIGSATSTGRLRERNEDSLLVLHLAWANLDERQELAILVVADGMGGYEGGDKASGLVVRSIGSSLSPLLASALSGQVRGPTTLLPETLDFALREANTTVYRQAQQDRGCRGMGATAAVALVWHGQALISNVGDVRAYHHRNGQLTQVTKDQTLVMRMVELGQLNEAEASRHPARHEVTQAVGKHPDLHPGRAALQLDQGDWLILACDGLHAHVDLATLEAHIDRAGPSPTVLAQGLVDLADQGGGSDNITVIALRCM
jgi:protein phosphatase